MIKKLIKLNVFIIILSLIFVSVSCVENGQKNNKRYSKSGTVTETKPSSNTESELLSDKVYYGGAYSLTTTESGISGTLKVIFKKENKLQKMATTTSIKWNDSYTISEVTPTENADEYKLKINILSSQITPLTKEGIEILKDDNNTKDYNIEWKVNAAQDVTSKLTAEDKTEVIVISISKDKKTIVLFYENNTDEKYTLTYRQ